MVTDTGLSRKNSSVFSRTPGGGFGIYHEAPVMKRFPFLGLLIGHSGFLFLVFNLSCSIHVLGMQWLQMQPDIWRQETIKFRCGGDLGEMIKYCLLNAEARNITPFVIFDLMAPFTGRLWHLHDVGCRAVIGPFPSRLSTCDFDFDRIVLKRQGSACMICSRA